MTMNFTSQELSSKYNRFAGWYDLVEGVPDLLGVRRLRNDCCAKHQERFWKSLSEQARTCGFVPKAAELSPSMSVRKC